MPLLPVLNQGETRWFSFNAIPPADAGDFIVMLGWMFSSYFLQQDINDDIGIQGDVNKDINLTL